MQVEELLQIVNHQLLNPLVTIVSDGRLLDEGHLGPLTARQQEAVGRIVKRGQYTLDLVRDYLDLARIELGQFEVRLRGGIDLIEEVIEPAVADIEHARADRSMTLVRDYGATRPRMTCDPLLLRTATINLLENAVKYGRPGGRIEIAVTEATDHVTVAVHNEGDGFAEGDRDRLFCKFSRLETPAHRAVPGTGVGLFAVRRMVELHGGSVDAASEEGRWARFRFTVPKGGPRDA